MHPHNNSLLTFLSLHIPLLVIRNLIYLSTLFHTFLECRVSLCAYEWSFSQARVLSISSYSSRFLENIINFHFLLSEKYHVFGVRNKHFHIRLFQNWPLFYLGPKTWPTGSPDPRSTEKRWLSFLLGSLSACPTCFLHTKFPSQKSWGYSQTLTPSIPRILEGADQSFFLSN